MPARRTRLIRAWVLDDKGLARLFGACGKTCGKLALACGILVDRAPMLADREGRMPGDAAWVWRELFSFYPDVCEEEVEQLLDLLHTRQYLQRYEAEGGSWIQLLYFAKDQCPDKRERASEIPAPPDFQPGQTGILPFGPFAVNSPEPSPNLRRTFAEPSAKLRPWDAMDTDDTGKTPPVGPPQNLWKTSRS
jgi:hypothetical protein